MPEVKYGPTPGPWKITDRSTYGMHANAARWEIGQKSGMEPYWVALAINEDNARLIAAAPEMYAALKALWEAVRRYDRIGHEGSELLEVMSDAKTALSKAEGR